MKRERERLAQEYHHERARLETALKISEDSFPDITPENKQLTSLVENQPKPSNNEVKILEKRSTLTDSKSEELSESKQKVKLI